MTGYTKYIERRKRVSAFQFLNTDQAPAVANEFFSSDFELWSNGTEHHLDVTIKNKDGSTYEQRVNRGDYIVHEGTWKGLPTVVPYREFREAWEEE